MNMLSIVGIAITACILAVLIRKYRPEIGLTVALCATVLIFLLVIPKIQPAFDEINKLVASAKVDSEYISILIKSLGLCFVAQVASDICRDAKETAIATNVEMAGKIAVLLITLPLFSQIAELIINLLKS